MNKDIINNVKFGLNKLPEKDKQAYFEVLIETKHKEIEKLQKENEELKKSKFTWNEVNALNLLIDRKTKENEELKDTIKWYEDTNDEFEKSKDKENEELKKEIDDIKVLVQDFEDSNDNLQVELSSAERREKKFEEEMR